MSISFYPPALSLGALFISLSALSCLQLNFDPRLVWRITLQPHYPAIYGGGYPSSNCRFINKIFGPTTESLDHYFCKRIAKQAEFTSTKHATLTVIVHWSGYRRATGMGNWKRERKQDGKSTGSGFPFTNSVRQQIEFFHDFPTWIIRLSEGFLQLPPFGSPGLQHSLVLMAFTCILWSTLQYYRQKLTL